MRCSRCGGEKPPSDFSPATYCTRGFAYWCKACAAAHRRTVPPLTSEQQHAKTLRKYNLTAEDYAVMFSAQGGCCAICQSPTPGPPNVRRFSVDHDHECCPGNSSCGLCVRGLLCRWCNINMGWLERNRERIEAYA